jgi:hypothetical protein
MKKALLDALERPTMSVPDAGELIGLSRNKSYQAAAEGLIPTIRFGKRLVVPTMPLKRMLGITISGFDQAARPTRSRRDEPNGQN